MRSLDTSTTCLMVTTNMIALSVLMVSGVGLVGVGAGVLGYLKGKGS